jgi:hypothetical protein
LDHRNFVREAIAEKPEREPALRPADDLGKDIIGKYGSVRDDLTSVAS